MPAEDRGVETIMISDRFFSGNARLFEANRKYGCLNTELLDGKSGSCLFSVVAGYR